ncbi:MAG: hypothetical protein HFH09_03605 [Bacilli bacterium]|jgi:hypothetical protein|nr:hypothetical protein [Bacilli bacterium]
MKKQIDILYVKKVIKPLEEVIHKVEVSDEFSQRDLETLNQLLLEKYLILEHILQENSSNSQ